MRRGTKRHYTKYREAARAVVHARLVHYNRVYGYAYRKVFIRNTRSRWGSCSTRGNLNFNYKVALLPEELRDYIIVHELCHLAEFNHSPAFWAQVARTFPHHRTLRRALRAVEKNRSAPVGAKRQSVRTGGSYLVRSSSMFAQAVPMSESVEARPDLTT